MLLDLKSAPSTLKRAINIILSTVKWDFALVYLDDVANFSRSIGEHLDHLRTVLELLSGAGVSLRLKTCFIFENHSDYLGHVTQPGTLDISTKATNAICGDRNSLLLKMCSKTTKEWKMKMSSEMPSLQKLTRLHRKLMYLYCSSNEIVVAHGPLCLSTTVAI